MPVRGPRRELIFKATLDAPDSLPARSNIAVGAGGYIKRLKANSVFSCASAGSGKSSYSMPGYSRNWRWKANNELRTRANPPATSHLLAIKQAPCFLPHVHWQRSAQHRSSKLYVADGTGGVTGQKAGKHGVAAGRANNPVDPARVR